MSFLVQNRLDGNANFTITLGGLAAGSSRQSTMIANTNNRASALVMVKIQTGAAAPTTGTVVEIFLLRNDNIISYSTDGAGATDAAITINNAQLLGTIVVNNNANAYFYGDFDTAPLGPLGYQWGIAIRNNTDQALNGTEGNFIKEYCYYLPEIL